MNKINDMVGMKSYVLILTKDNCRLSSIYKSSKLGGGTGDGVFCMELGLEFHFLN